MLPSLGKHEQNTTYTIIARDTEKNSAASHWMSQFWIRRNGSIFSILSSANFSCWENGSNFSGS